MVLVTPNAQRMTADNSVPPEITRSSTAECLLIFSSVRTWQRMNSDSYSRISKLQKGVIGVDEGWVIVVEASTPYRTPGPLRHKVYVLCLVILAATNPVIARYLQL